MSRLSNSLTEGIAKGSTAKGPGIEMAHWTPPKRKSFGRAADSFTYVIFAMSFFIVTIYDSRFLSIYGLDDFQIAINRSLYAVLFFGLFIGLLRLRFKVTVISILLLAYFTFLIIEFMHSSKQSLGGGSEFGFAPFYSRLQLLLAPMLSILISRGKNEKVQNTIYAISAIYIFVYIYSSIVIASSASRDFRAAGFVASYDERSARIVLDNSLISLAFFISLTNLSRKRIVPWIILAASIAAVYLSFSRYYQFCLAIVTFIYFVLRTPKRVLVTSGLLFSLITLIFFGQMVSGQNPFMIFSGDRSLAARATSFEAVQPIIQDHLLLGVGLAGAPEDDMLMTRLNPFFWTDIGMAGILYAGGIFGTIIFLIMSFLCFLSPALLRRAQMPKGLYSGICLAAACTALYGVIAPTLWYNGLKVFVFVLGGMFARPQVPLRKQQVDSYASPIVSESESSYA